MITPHARSAASPDSTGSPATTTNSMPSKQADDAARHTHTERTIGIHTPAACAGDRWPGNPPAERPCGACDSSAAARGRRAPIADDLEACHLGRQVFDYARSARIRVGDDQRGIQDRFRWSPPHRRTQAAIECTCFPTTGRMPSGHGQPLNVSGDHNKM
jgi:hypothetical protein